MDGFGRSVAIGTGTHAGGRAVTSRGAFAFAQRCLTRTLVLGFVCVVPVASNSLAALACKPILSIRSVREVRSPLRFQPYVWQATIVVNSRFCATSSGDFEIDFIRIKEYAPDLQFTERYRWSGSQVDISFELSTDESILDHRLGFVAPCVCREHPALQ